jgi:phage FluMu protein Com
MTYVPKEAVDAAHKAFGGPCDEFTTIACAGCGRTLTATEREYYEVTCEDCEGKEMQAVREEELRELNKPEQVDASEYSYSWDEERYHGNFNSREEALAEAFATYETAQSVFTGRNVPFQPDWEGAAESALEQLECQAGDECGECSEDWNPERNKQIVARVAAAIQAAVTELDAPCFYTVEDVQRHDREAHPS